MKRKKFIRPSVAFAAALVLAMSLSVVAAGQAVWRHLEVRVVQGEEFVRNIRAEVAEDGSTVLGFEFDEEAMQAAGDAAIIIEIDGKGEAIITMYGDNINAQMQTERIVMRDVLHLDNLEDMLQMLEIDNPLLPSYLPQGFVFKHAAFNVNPINHPEEPMAAGRAFVDFARGDETIRLQITQWDAEWGIGVFSEDQVHIELAATGHEAAVADGMLAVIIDDVMYFIAGPLTFEELIKIAESLE